MPYLCLCINDAYFIYKWLFTIRFELTDAILETNLIDTVGNKMYFFLLSKNITIKIYCIVTSFIFIFRNIIFVIKLS